ncbi:MAG TPA: OsmC family protein [Phototrophicaceae bacterium]|nr:OsmC family protein [Phototrophicaceae bacterium]
MPGRVGEAVWKGDLQTGSGSLKVGSGAFSGAYSFKSRFEDGTGTNPEELLGAAHAACFSMALSAGLARAGFKVNSVDTTSTVHLEKTDKGNQITHIDLVTTGDVEGIDEAKFKEMAEATKTGCIVSQALSAVPMTINASLVK